MADGRDDEEEKYVLQVAGRVNNEKRRGLEWILELQALLGAEERIGSRRGGIVAS